MTRPDLPRGRGPADPAAPVDIFLSDDLVIRFETFSIRDDPEVHAAQIGQATYALSQTMLTLKGLPIFMDGLSAHERDLMNRMNIRIINTERVAYAAELRDGVPEIQMSVGARIYIGQFMDAVRRVTDYEDAGFIELLLASEATLARPNGRRWYDPIIYMKGVGYPEITWSETEVAQMGGVGTHMTMAPVLHELCHHFLGHARERGAAYPSREVVYQQELDADRCAADHMLRIGANPQFGLLAILAVNYVTDDEAAIEHPVSRLRIALMREAGEAHGRRMVAEGVLTEEKAGRMAEIVDGIEGIFVTVRQRWGPQGTRWTAF